MMLTPNPKIATYHALLREGKDEEAARLYESLRSETQEALDKLITRTHEHTVIVQEAVRGAKVNYRRTYQELMLDYRTAMRIAKDCSDMKKQLREHMKSRHLTPKAA